MMSTWTNALPYFPAHELACSCCGIVKLDTRAAAALPNLRVEWGHPLVLTSACRCPAHNTAVGGHPRSLHLTGMSEMERAMIRETEREERFGTMGFDIAWKHLAEVEQVELANLAHALGWSVGLHPAFMHADRRIEIGLEQTAFEYGAWEGFAAAEVGDE